MSIKSKQHCFYWRVWRFQFRVVLMRHQYASTPDRIVLQTSVIYDRAGRYS